MCTDHVIHALNYLHMNIHVTEVNEPINVIIVYTLNGSSTSQYISLILLMMYFQCACTHLFPACHWWIYIRACPYELPACSIVTLQYTCIICMFTNWNSWLVNHNMWYKYTWQRTFHILELKLCYHWVTGYTSFHISENINKSSPNIHLHHR